MKKLINTMEDGYLTLLRCQDKKRHQILVHEKLTIFLICMTSNVTKLRSENKKSMGSKVNVLWSRVYHYN